MEDTKQVEIAACPFCKGRDGYIREFNGSAELQHWCESGEVRSSITIRAGDVEAVLKHWNRRED